MRTCEHIRRGRYLDSMCQAPITLEETNGKRRVLHCEAGHHVTEIKCCGAWLLCDGFTNTCPKCEADYNWNGYRLARRSQWGEETGESFGGDPADNY